MSGHGLLKQLALLSACLLFLARFMCAQFETRGSSVVNNYPTSLTVGDFNHDGKLDIAVIAGSSNENTLAILIGNGDGTFLPASYYTVGIGPLSVTTADFNHDGNLDLAVGSEANYIAVLLGNGDGTFQNAIESPSVPASVRYIASGSFNKDGKIDLLMRADGNAITVLLGNGDGTFQSALTTYAPFSVETVGVGDVNGDGKLDLVTGGTFGSSSTLNVWLGNGDGTFDYGEIYQDSEYPTSIVLADFNRDGKLDLGVINLGDIQVMLGNGDGTFQPVSYTYVMGENDWGVAADLNGDGKLDLAVAADFPPSGVHVFPGNGDGTFGAPTFYQAGENPVQIAVGDFNGDGKKDLAVPDNHSNDVIVLLNTGTVAFSPANAIVFQKQAVGTKSPVREVTLTNMAKTALKISSIKASAQFGMTTTCHANVAAGTNCTISVVFMPKSQGTISGTITVDDNASSKPMVIELTGTGG
jgi:FG-GAP-like repeat/Abnormal spindle-like microcephaly-assoc'd, ASPM-SPD-2-Hydin